MAITKSLEYIEDNYRKDATELYDQVLRFPRKDIFSKDFIGLVYETLKAFNMNSKGARLSELPVFTKSIKKHAKTIQSLVGLKLEKVKESDSGLMDTIGFLLDNLELVQTNSPLVTFSKTMHFFLPDLFMPIDRKYTIQFFYRNPSSYKQVNYGLHSVTNTLEKQQRCFHRIFEEFRHFAHAHSDVLKAQVNPNSRWNRNIPKIIDNIIIAYVSKNMEE